MRKLTYLFTLLIIGCQGPDSQESTQQKRPPVLFSIDKAISSDESVGFDSISDSGTKSISFNTSLLQTQDTLAIQILDKFIEIYITDSRIEEESGNKFWAGISENNDVNFSAFKSDSIYSASLALDSMVYEISYGESGYEIMSINTRNFRDEPEGYTGKEDEKDNDSEENRDEKKDKEEGLTDSGDEIDVLVYYSDDARTRSGGKAQIEAFIKRVVSETNTSFTVSAVNTSFKLVGYEEIAYDETGNSTEDVNWAQSNVTIKAKRNALRADLVFFMVEKLNDNICGEAYRVMETVSTSFAPNAYAVVKRNCASSYKSFAHEAGHLMGCLHNCKADDDSRPYKFAHGYSYCGDAKWRTIMSYSECKVDDRKYLWSNPDKKIGGVPTGIESETCGSNNAKTLNNTVRTVANFRQRTTS